MTPSARPSSIRRHLAVAALAGLPACYAYLRDYDLVDLPLTCAQADRHAYRTLQVMRFTVTAIDPALPGRPGQMHAARTEGRRKQEVTVAVSCDDRAARVDAGEDGSPFHQLEFKRGFYMSFRSLPQTTDGDTGSAPTAGAGQRPHGLQLLLQPVGGPAAKLDFALDLAAAGILPVLLTLDNGSERQYGFAVEDVVLVGKDGTRAAPMSLDEAVRAAVRASPTAAAAKPLAAGEIRRRLAARQLRSGTLAARQARDGFLYFPLADYERGRVTVEDIESHDTEGFAVEF